MTVDLAPAEQVDISQEILDFASELYCANCIHVLLEESEAPPGVTTTPYCKYWSEPTKLESGKICAEYLPQGFRDES